MPADMTPASVGTPYLSVVRPWTLQKIYTLQELQTASTITSLTTSAKPVTSRQSAGSEFEESDLTDMEGHCEVIEESTDTEMPRQTHTLMITSDREKV